MTRTQLFPALLIALDLGAAIMFAAVTAVAVILFSLDPVKLP